MQLVVVRYSQVVTKNKSSQQENLRKSFFYGKNFKKRPLNQPFHIYEFQFLEVHLDDHLQLNDARLQGLQVMIDIHQFYVPFDLYQIVILAEVLRFPNVMHFVPCRTLLTENIFY